ncbi:TRAP transporter small permease subunit [Halocynthiibacter namhaensis]|uniref:TRAP transporter small permease subunit n=1 Tax=Halocynthiibacter namhaensis TaxID=1290553 RepID=UPI000579418A|nr:TRAP transporter small permease subunit [Halocynthiibacter namhaensis]
MNGILRGYIRWTDALNYRIGRVAMYLIFALVGVLLWSIMSRILSFNIEGYRPANWTLETAQFVMVAYYILGGPYSIQLGSNVRMDLFYGGWTVKQKAWMDFFTVFFLFFYLGVLLQGAVSSLSYSLGYYKLDGQWGFLGQIIWGFLTGGPSGAGEIIGRLEVSATAWKPVLWPIKLTLALGITLMIIQTLSEFFKDILRIKGEDI